MSFRIKEFLLSKKSFLVFLIMLNVILHFPFIELPPCSIHVWRQCNTLSVARNFSEEDMNILKPRVDQRWDTDGVTGMQFPLYEWIVALIYKTTGESFSVSRIFSLFLFSLSLFFFYSWIKTIFSSIIAAVATWSLCWSPELFYHSINALPDILALLAAIFSCFCFSKFRLTLNKRFLFAGLFSLLIAGLVKIQYLMFGVVYISVVYDLFQRKMIGRNGLIAKLFAGLLVLLTVVGWYAYAISLIEKSNLRDFGLEWRPERDLEKAAFILKDNLISDIPELLFNYAGTLLFIIGAFWFFKYKKWKNFYSRALLIVLCLYSVFHLLELHQMNDHQYYMFPLILLGVIVMGYAGNILVERKQILLLSSIMIAQPLLASIRILPARWLKEDKAVPMELFIEVSRSKLIEAVPDNDLCIVGPDESGVIYFYYLKKKGFGFSSATDLAEKGIDGKLKIEDCIARGAKYIYTNDSTILNKPELIPFIHAVTYKEGKFIVAVLKENKNYY